MEPIIDELAHLLLHKSTVATQASSSASSRRILVGVCGIPASGKTSFALRVVSRINQLHSESQRGGTSPSPSPRTSDDKLAICISQDGWHFPRATLDTFPDVKEAYDRRGAAFTFDGVSYVEFIRSLRRQAPNEEVRLQEDAIATVMGDGDGDGDGVVYAPSFSHTLKDPTPNALSILPSHRIVIIEGLYTCLNVVPWRSASEAMDERWYIRVDKAEGRERLVKRHVVTSVAKDIAEAEWRVDTNDGPNGVFLEENMFEPTRVIDSVYDPSIASHTRIE